MNSSILFSESQKFRQWWVLLIFLVINLVFMAGAYQQIIKGEQFGNNPVSDRSLLIISFIVVLFTILFLQMRLETTIKNDGIYVRFYPFHIKFRHYSWDALSRSYVRKYSPLAEYGGWGYRIGIFGNGKAFNVSGNKGLQLEFKNKKRLLIGTLKPTEISAVLEQLGQAK